MFKKISVWCLFTLLLVNLWSVPLAHAADSITTTDVDEYVKQYLDQNGLPGAAVVIVKDGELIYEKGYGHDSEGNQLTANTKIGLASGTKPFTAFAVLQLVDEGKVELDEPITSYLSNLTISDNRWDQVTVRHLLSHTSGLPNPTIVGPAFTLKEGVERLQNWELKTDPGENYFYSNANYWVLAYLVEQVSGMSFNDYLTENIFLPLEMKDSISLVNSGDIYHETSIPQGYVTLYGTAMPWTELEKMFSGSGSIFTTAHDMGKWLAMHTNSDKAAGGEPLLSQSLLEESYALQTKNNRYGLGWSLSTSGTKPPRISHSGSISTFQSQQDIVPSSGYAVAVLLNSFTPTFEHAYEISSGIINITEGNQPEVGTSIPKVIDFSLGFLTIIYLVLGIRGIFRSKKWAVKRLKHSIWRYGFRLIPQALPVVLIGWLLFIVPTLQNNSSTTLDAFGLFPAAMILLVIALIFGLILMVLRIFYRIKLN